MALIEKRKTTIIGKDVKNVSTCTLLVQSKVGTLTDENSSIALPKLNIKLPYKAEIPFLTKRTKNKYPNRYFCAYVSSSTIHERSTSQR